MKENQKAVDGKTSDSNRIVNSGKLSTVNPNLGNIYELQFRMMQEVVSNMEQNDKVAEEQAIVPKNSGALEPSKWLVHQPLIRLCNCSSMYL